MKIPGTGNYTKLTETAWTRPAPTHTAASQKSASQRFDSIMLSTAETRRTDFQRELESRLTQEVRCATSSGEVQRLREQIQSGSYRVDAMEIARKMLLVGVI